MSAVQDLVIHFDYDDNNEKQFYLPGEVLRGTAMLHLTSSLRVHTITMHAIGSAMVSWEQPEKKKTYTSQEKYLDGSKSLLDTRYGSPFSLGPGSHEFRFNYRLPSDLPSSFIGVYGSVTYLLKVIVETEDERQITISSEPFLVFRRPPVPPNTLKELVLKKKKTYFNLCNTGDIQIETTLNRSAGIPGEYLFVNAEVTNWSSREISLIQSAFIMNSIYYAKGKKILFRQIINKRSDVYDVPQLKGRRWRNVRMSVPPYIPETNLSFCNIMDVTYSFQFRVDLGGKEIVVESPIIIGGHPPGHGPQSDLTSMAHASLAREFPWYIGQHSMTESVDGDLFDLR